MSTNDKPIEDVIREAAEQEVSDDNKESQAAAQASLRGAASEEADEVLKQSEMKADKLLEEASRRAAKLVSDAHDAAELLKKENAEKAEGVKETAKLLAANVERAINPLRYAIEQHLVAINRSIEVSEEGLRQGTAIRAIVEELARRGGELK